MSRLMIVHDTLRQAIDAKLDAALIACPDAASEREQLFQQLIAYFDKRRAARLHAGEG